MNIFALHQDPRQAARAHCDQHLHKMILESAQMVSTALHARGRKFPYLYKPAYPNHPCTIWVSQCTPNLNWILALADELEVIRQELDQPYHASSEIIKYARDYIQDEDNLKLCYYFAEPRIFCGPAFLALRQTITVEKKYQLYYQYKYRQWLDTRQPMSYRNRPLPDFLSPFKDSICHV